MGRPQRHDVDYFPFYVKDGKTLFVLESKYGCTGTGFFTNVMKFLSRTPDHHFCISDPGDRMWFFSKTYCDEESGLDMLNLMAQTKKIDPGLWHHKQVIVSQDHLDSITDAYKRRNNDIITIHEVKRLYRLNESRNLYTNGLIPTKKQDELSLDEFSQAENHKLKDTKGKDTKITPEVSGGHFEKLVGEYFESIKKTCECIEQLPAINEKPFNPYQWVQFQYKSNIHLGAIDETLKGIQQYWDNIETTPWQYACNVIKTKSQNFNEREAIEIHKKLKNMKTTKEVEVLTHGMIRGIE